MDSFCEIHTDQLNIKSWPACREKWVFFCNYMQFSWILCHYLKNDGLLCLNTHQNTLKPSKICGWSPRNWMLHQGTSGLPASPSTTPKFLAQAGSFRVFQHVEVQSSLGWHLLYIYVCPMESLQLDRWTPAPTMAHVKPSQPRSWPHCLRRRHLPFTMILVEGNETFMMIWDGT